MAERNKQDHYIKPLVCQDTTVDEDGRSVAEVKNFLMQLDPGRFDKAAKAYLDAAGVLAEIVNELETISYRMSRCWEGKASVEAQKALRLLHATSREMGMKLGHMGNPLEQLADKVREHKDFIENKSFSWANTLTTWDDSTPGLFATIDGKDFGSPDELAGLHLKKFNDDLMDTFTALPSSFHKELPKINEAESPDLKTVDPRLSRDLPWNDGRNGSTGPFGADGAFQGSGAGGTDGSYGPNGVNGPNGSNGQSGPNGVNSPGGVNGSNGPNGPNGPNGGGSSSDPGRVPGTEGASPTTPAGTVPPGTTPATGGAPAHPSTSQGNGATAPDLPDTSTYLEDYTPPAGWDTPSTSTPQTSSGPSTSSSTPYTSTASPHSAPPSAAPVRADGGFGSGGSGQPATVNGQAGARANLGNGMGMPILPMGGMGGAGGQDQSPSESGTWLHEDDDVWGGDVEGVVDHKLC